MDLTTGPLPKTLARMALPASLGFLFNTLLNVVDTYFAGEISTEALAGLSLSFPVFFMILSLGMGYGTATTALVANALGRGDMAEAQRVSAQAFVLSLWLGVGLALVGQEVAEPLFRLMGAEGEYLDTAMAYMEVVLLGGLFFVPNGVINGALTARGDSRSYRDFLVLGFFLNIVLDPWFLYGGLGVPAMGIAGIAWATVAIQAFGSVFLLYKLLASGLWKGYGWRDFMPSARYYAEISRQGIPSSLNMMTVAIGVFVITYFISHYGKEAVAAYGIATRIEQLALLPTIGLNIALLSVAGQSLGAGLVARAREAYGLTLRYGIIIMSVGMALVFLADGWLIRLFTDEASVVAIGEDYLAVAVLVFNSYVLLNLSVSVTQALKRPMFGLWIGLFRQIAMPALLFGAMVFWLRTGIWGIWWSILGINWSAALFAWWHTRRRLRLLAPKA